MLVVTCLGVSVHTGNTSLLEKGGKGWIQTLMGQITTGSDRGWLALRGLPSCFHHLCVLCVRPNHEAAPLCYSARKLEDLAIVLHLLEAYFVLMFCAIGHPAWQVQAISFELVNNKLQAIVTATTKR